MQRLLTVEKAVNRIIDGLADETERAVAHHHLQEVSSYCKLLARKRKLDIELCAVAGILHDIKTYATGDSSDHGPLGAEMAADLLYESGEFDDREVMIITSMIRTHSRKKQIDNEYQELLKDADVLSHYFGNKGKVESKERHHWKKLCNELKL